MLANKRKEVVNHILLSSKFGMRGPKQWKTKRTRRFTGDPELENCQKIWKCCVEYPKVEIGNRIQSKDVCDHIWNIFCDVSGSHMMAPQLEISVECWVSGTCTIMYNDCVFNDNKYQSHRPNSSFNLSNRWIIIAPGSKSIKMNPSV